MTDARRAPSMQDVAAAAGVSAQTVSRALRGHPYVTAEKRERVLAAVEALGYRMNAAAAALSSGRTRTLGVVTVATATYAAGMTQASLERAAEAEGYAVVGGQSATLDADAILAAIRRLEENGAEALILALPSRASDDRIEAIARRLPTVTLGGSPLAGGRSLAVDQHAVARLATTHLLDLGHRTVAHVAGPDDWVDAAHREAGWANTLRAAGRIVPEVIRGDWTPQSGYRAGEILAVDPSVTAVFCASDEMAMGLIAALFDNGRRVPEDVSVVSVDDITMAAYARPALTTVAQPFDELCRAAVASVIARLEKRDDPTGDIVLAPELRVRDSTARVG